MKAITVWGLRTYFESGQIKSVPDVLQPLQNDGACWFFDNCGTCTNNAGSCYDNNGTCIDNSQMAGVGGCIGNEINCVDNSDCYDNEINCANNQQCNENINGACTGNAVTKCDENSNNCVNLTTRDLWGFCCDN